MRVPTYDTPQVETRALPGVRESSVASPALFGAQADQVVAAGKGIMQAGAGLAQFQHQQDADTIFRAETALKEDYLAFEDDVRNNRRGQKAWGVTKDADKWFADQEKKHAQNLTNDVQRQLFGQSVTKLRQSAMGSLSTFEAGERRRSIEESANASIVGSINLAAANAADWYRQKPEPVAQPEGDATTTAGPDGVPVTRVNVPVEVTARRDPMLGIKADVLKRVQVLADLNGWTPERKSFEEAKHLTNLHKQVIQSLVDKDPTAAREYYEANREEINGAEFDSIDRVLKHGETKQAGFQFAERTDIRQLSAADQRTAARDFYKDDPDKRDAALREINTRDAEAISNRERGQRSAADAAWGIYGRSGRLDDVPASVLASMDGRDLQSLQDHAAAKAAGKGVVTDANTYLDLRDMLRTDPAGFRKLDLRRYIGKLSPSDLEEFAKLQTSKGSELKDAATLSQQLGNTHNLLNWGGSDKAKKGAFDKAATDAIQTEARQRGRELNYEERQAVIDRMLIQGEVDGSGWFSDSMRYYEATPEQRAKFAPSSTDRKAIIERFKSLKGRAPSDEEIIEKYRIWKGL